jgi:hypothetical protein
LNAATEEADRPERPLSAAELELGGVGKLVATLSVMNGTALIRIDYIEGTFRRPFGLKRRLLAVARAEGAKRIRVEARLANTVLLAVLLRRYGFTTDGDIEVWEEAIE